MERCPNCGSENSNARKYEYECLVRRFESLAIDSGSIRDMVMLAENHLRQVAHGITRNDSPDLADKEHWQHVYSARRLLDAAAQAKVGIK